MSILLKLKATPDAKTRTQDELNSKHTLHP